MSETDQNTGSVPKTSLHSELDVQRRWHLRQQSTGLTIFDELVRNEFLEPAEIRQRQYQRLSQLLRFCARYVPYYSRLLDDSRLSGRVYPTPEDFRALPILTKSQIQEHRRELCASELPPGHGKTKVIKTSGTTGQPLTVKHTLASVGMFGILKQREYRWFRWQPDAVMVAIRPAKDLPPRPDGKLVELGEVSGTDAWPGVGGYFATGPFYGFQRANPMEIQKRWLGSIQPEYIVAQCADLEQLALAYQAEVIPAGLQGILGVTQQMTPDMLARIERSFGVPVEQNYGLNEIGLVASRCPEAGRYHVHAEHCLLEIVDGEGNPCRRGERGRILVTGLGNLAMPLLRYDTDDLAEVSDSPCPCGRTLPSFGRIHGRYRRLNSLPAGTMDFFMAVEHTLSDLPTELTKSLRQYQLHQFLDGHFELRVVAVATLPAAFTEKIMDSWKKVESRDPVELKIVEVDQIPRPPSGKFQNFTSDFVPPPDVL